MSDEARRIRREREAERSERTEARRAAGRDAPWRRRIRDLRRASGKKALHALAPKITVGLAKTWRIERRNPEHFDDCLRDGPFVISLWHGAMFAMAPIHRGQDVAILVSPSGDGDLVVGVMNRLGYRVVRGSISRAGSRAMREMRDLLRSGVPVVITPDGPRGPRHTMNVGPAWLAREADCPWVPLACEADRAIRLRSWDRFFIPKPRARVIADYLPPVRIPASASDLDLERIAAQERERVLEAGNALERELGRPAEERTEG
ncbi:MAG: lysophospholipid acyltransferase family protein [Planctomycetota bacterium]